jgi:hypothetical protein
LKILYAKKTEYRDELFARAIQAGVEIQSTNRKLLLRMRLYAYPSLSIAVAKLLIFII